MKKKEIIKIFIVTILFAVAGGLSFNFQELWLQSNGLSIKTVGTILALCSFITASVVFLCSNLVNNKSLKRFALFLLLFKFISNLSLYLLDGTNQFFLLKFISLLDYAAHFEFSITIYPLLSLIKSSDKLYAKEVLTFDGANTFGIMLSTILLSKTFYSITIEYKTYLLMASILCLLSFIILCTLKLDNNKKSDTFSFNMVLSKVRNSKSYICFLAFHMLNSMACFGVTNLIFTILSGYLGYVNVFASKIQLTFMLLSVVLGFLALRFLTFKNNYINIAIKFGVRALIFLLAFIINNKFFITLSIMTLYLTVDIYEDTISAPFINNFKNDEKLAFTNLNNIAGCFGIFLGTLISTLIIEKSLRLVLLNTFVIFTLVLLFRVKAEKNKDF